MEEIKHLETVPFQGDNLRAVHNPDGTILVSVREIAESIGLGYSSQLQKLRQTSWAGVTIIVTPDERNRPQEHAMISADAIPLWMATIRTSKVSPDARPKLERYQNEVKKVLADYFLGTISPKSQQAILDAYDPEDEMSLQLAIMLKSRNEVLALKRAQDAQWQAIQATGAVAIEAEQKATLALHTATATKETLFNRTGWISALGYSRELGLKVSVQHLAAIGKLATKLSEKRGIEVQQTKDARFGRVNIYREDVLAELEPEFIRRAG